MDPHHDLIVVGAGAAGLMTAIQAARHAPAGSRILLLDGSKKPGVKILVAGGGRCNVTHHRVDETAYAGGSRATVRKALRAFGVDDTVAFFRELGVELKREPTGKLFPTTDSAQTVLDALLRETRRLGIVLRHPHRVSAIERSGDSWRVRGASDEPELTAPQLVLATGGRALPRSGSDGGGYELAGSAGHSITDHTWPALVPLTAASAWIRELSGISSRGVVDVRSGTNKRIVSFENDLLCTHFGLSGPGVMDASRYLTEARRSDTGAHLVVNWLPGVNFDAADRELSQLGAGTVLAHLRSSLPERLARSLCGVAGVDPMTKGASLSRQDRRALAHQLVECRIEIEGDRGFSHAEATAGGVPLNEVDIRTMESRRSAGLWLVGELLDIDGRIGGFNFQWAWTTGAIAGRAIAKRLSEQSGD